MRSVSIGVAIAERDGQSQTHIRGDAVGSAGRGWHSLIGRWDVRPYRSGRDPTNNEVGDHDVQRDEARSDRCRCVGDHAGCTRC
jgi:hypothetical protein